MSKRLTDTDKWKKPFIKSLPVEYKIFWLFLLDECDHAGIWHTELDIAEARLGIKLSLEKIRGLFKGKVVEFDSGNKMFVPDFVQFQYGILNPENKAHRSVINILDRYNLMEHVSPFQRAKDKDKELDKDKDTDMVGGIYSIEHCAFLALRDDRFVSSNKTDKAQLKVFNEYLESTAVYEKDILDYKSHYARWKKKQPKPVIQKPSEPVDPSNQW
jgi:hypothetical protein